MVKTLAYAKLKKTKGKTHKYVVLFKGRIVSRHRTESNARKKYNKYLRIAKKLIIFSIFFYNQQTITRRKKMPKSRIKAHYRKIKGRKTKIRIRGHIRKRKYK